MPKLRMPLAVIRLIINHLDKAKEAAHYLAAPFAFCAYMMPFS